MIRNVSSSSACEHSGSDVTRWPLAGHWLPETLPSPQRVVHEAPTGAQWSSCCQSDGSVNMPRLLSHTITSKLTSVCCCCSCLVYCTEATSLVCSYTVTQPATIRTISLNIYKHIQRRTRRVYYTHTHMPTQPQVNNFRLRMDTATTCIAALVPQTPGLYRVVLYQLSQAMCCHRETNNASEGEQWASAIQMMQRV